MGDEKQRTERAHRDRDVMLRHLDRLWISGMAGVPRQVAAEQLVAWGWTRMRPGERVIGPADAALLNEVQCAYVRWESLKKKFRENQAESAEVSCDESQLTSDVKSAEYEKRILAVFAATERPLTYHEACDTASGEAVRFFPDRPWHVWNAAFRSLEDHKLIEALPAAKGEVRRYQLTQAGRSLHELDGVDL